MEKIRTILQIAEEKGASDIHIAPNRSLILRVDGELVPIVEMQMQIEDINELLATMLEDEQQMELKKQGQLDFAHSVAGMGRIRVNAFRQRGTYAMVWRVLTSKIPDPWQLGIPESVLHMIDKKRGLVLVTGITGSGKSTTLASLIQEIGKKYAKNIITLEDPIEYLHQHNKSIVLQREIGMDINSYADGLRAVLRQDPDVILVGEMRDLETISTAITAAETGHLVFSTLHTNDVSTTIDRIIDVFPAHQQEQVRVQLANVLEGVVSQQLLPVAYSNGRVAAFEVLIANYAIRNLIREGKVYQIPSSIQTGRKSGMQTMDDAIYELYEKGEITGEVARTFAHDSLGMEQKVGKL